MTNDNRSEQQTTKEGAAQPQREDEMVDESTRDSFVANDGPAFTPVQGAGNPPEPRQDQDEIKA